VNVSEHEKLYIAREILLSWVAGIVITLLLAVLRAVHIAPGVTDILLRPGLYLDRAVHGKSALNTVVLALGDGAIYGLLPFVVMHLRSRRRGPLSRTPERKDRRRSSRVALATPVFVYGWLADEPFAENTETLNVSAVGGLIQLSAKVIPSHELILTNLKTNEDLPCRVARSIRAGDGKTLVGVDFLQASPNFWQIDFVSNSPRSFIEPVIATKRA
jgi:hypothetical protein